MRILQGRVTVLRGKICSLLMRAFAFPPLRKLREGRGTQGGADPKEITRRLPVRPYVNNIDERMRSHRNPVKRGLVSSAEQWEWSSCCFYRLDKAGPVRVNEGWTKISFRVPAA